MTAFLNLNLTITQFKCFGIVAGNQNGFTFVCQTAEDFYDGLSLF